MIHQKVAQNIEASRPHKLNLNLQNNLPFSHKTTPFSIFHKRPNKPHFQTLTHLPKCPISPISQTITYPTSTKRPHKPDFLNSHSLTKNKTTKTSPFPILYKKTLKAQNPKQSFIKLQDSSSRLDKTTILQRSQAFKIQDSKSRSWRSHKPLPLTWLIHGLPLRQQPTRTSALFHQVIIWFYISKFSCVIFIWIVLFVLLVCSIEFWIKKNIF